MVALRCNSANQAREAVGDFNKRKVEREIDQLIHLPGTYRPSKKKCRDTGPWTHLRLLTYRRRELPCMLARRPTAQWTKMSMRGWFMWCAAPISRSRVAWLRKATGEPSWVAEGFRTTARVFGHPLSGTIVLPSNARFGVVQSSSVLTMVTGTCFCLVHSRFGVSAKWRHNPS